MQSSAAIVTPEERWVLLGERRASAPFNPENPTHCIVCDLEGYPSSIAVLNASRALLICTPEAGPGGEARALEVRGSALGTATLPSCASHTPDSPDGQDLLVGLANGEVALLSLATLVAPDAPPFAVPLARYNENSSDAGGRCTAVSWIAGTAGSAFVSTHGDGSVIIRRRLCGRSLDASLLQRSNSQLSSSQVLSPALTLMGNRNPPQQVVAAPSPKGTFIAVAGKDGNCIVYRTTSRHRVGGFRSWYGGFTCLAWSEDERLLAGGAEDDLIHIYSMPEDDVIAICSGHSSWVSAVTFDSVANCIQEEGLTENGRNKPPPSHSQYRLASVAQDCYLCLWDIAVSPLATAASPTAEYQENGHISWRHTRAGSSAFASRSRSEIPQIKPLIRQRMTIDPLSDICLGSTDIVLSTYGGGWIRLRRAPLQQQQQQGRMDLDGTEEDNF